MHVFILMAYIYFFITGFIIELLFFRPNWLNDWKKGKLDSVKYSPLKVKYLTIKLKLLNDTRYYILNRRFKRKDDLDYKF